MNKPQFELTRVFADGSKEAPQVVPLGEAVLARCDRRGILGAGLAVSSVLSLLRRAQAQSPAGRAPTALGAAGRAHSSPVYSVAFSPDGKMLASGSSDETVKLWSLPEGALLKTLSGHNSSVSSVAFSPDGELLASGSYDQTVKLWSLPEGALLKTLSGHNSSVSSVAFSPDGKVLASGKAPSGSDQLTVKLWSLPEGALLEALPGHDHTVSSVAFSPDGKVLASGCSDQTVKLWSLSGGALLKTLPGFLKTLPGFTLPGSDLPGYGAVNSVAFSPDGKVLASGCSETVNLWSLPGGAVLNPLSGHDSRVKSVAFSPDGKVLASGSDKIVKLWSLPEGALLKTLSGHDHNVSSVAFSPDGKVLASGSFDMTVKLWSLSGGALLTQLVDLAASPPDVKGSTITGRNAQGQPVTYTLPCGSPIPPSAVCTCNCVPGTYVIPRSSGGSRSICTCVPIMIRSDRHSKENLAEIDEADILATLARMPVQSWRYQDESADVRHIGPMAQDFAAAFGLGDSDKHIHAVDAIGVSLACIRELYRLTLAQRQEITELRQMLASR